jgi:tRNA uracil 4-sulfurtransferase
VTTDETRPQSTEFICKPGELLLKSKPVRAAFSRQLIHNLRDASGAATGSKPGTTSIFREQGIYTVRTRDPAISQSLRRVFGITSVSSVHRFESSDLEDIVARSCLYFRASVAGKRFAVRCHRSGRTAFRSPDVARALGAALLPLSSGVDLSHPDVICKLDIHDSTVRLYHETVPASGGLPVGTQGKAVVLMSGGIDSPVAAWYGLKRGLELHYLFCCLGGPLQLWGPKTAVRHLALNWSYGYRPQLYVADFNELLTELKTIDHRYRNILLKRYFFRAADKLADAIGADAIVTGESLGQVSSQTVSNLGMISRVTQRLIFRPLIGLDKTEIIEVARKIGTLETSEKVPEFCNVAVRKPKTRSYPDDIEMYEKRIHQETADRACACWVKTDIKQMPSFSEEPSLSMDGKPPGAWLIWIARPDVKIDPPAGTDEVVDMLDLSGFLTHFSRTGIVLFACPHGTISRDAASYAREQGLDAYALVR